MSRDPLIKSPAPDAPSGKVVGRQPDLTTRASWQRWEMDSLETLKPQGSAEPKPGEATVAKADWLRQRAETLSQAREQGRAKGYAAGYEQGQREGYAQGLAESRREGLVLGEREGHAAGLRAGHEEGLAAVQDQARRLQTLADCCARSLETLETEVGQSLISLSIRIAEQVLRTSLQDHPGQVVDMVGELLRARPQTDTSVQLRLHPDDLELLKSHLDDDINTIRPRLIADERITRGGCVLETAQGTIDATLETRWRRVIGALGHVPEQP